MGEVLKTPDGYVTVFNKYDLIDTVRSYISDDFADFIDNNFRDYDSEEELNKMYFESDYGNLEMSLDQMHTVMEDVCVICEKIEELLSEKRLNKEKLAKFVQEIYNNCMEVM